jgi:long-chain acyl-CoA synthetase
LPETGIKTLVVADFADSLPFPQNILFRIFKRRQIARLRWNDKHHRFRDLLKAEGEWRKPDLDPETDVAMLQYTGGTTGVPKGAMLTHANLTVNAQQSVAAFRDLRDGQEVIHGVLPFFHIFALIAVGFVSVLKGATIVMQPRFKLEDVLEDLERRGVTLLPAVPTMLTAINHAIEEKPRRFPHLKLVVSGGASLPVEVARKWVALTGVDIREGYGLTEASPVVALTPAGGGKEGSIGLPLPGTVVSIVGVDDAAQAMPMGQPGELAVEGPQVMKGYWRRPDETAEVMHGKQLLTGDIGVMDADGYVFIVDRKKETIKVSGYNVFPRTIEEAIYQHPAVKEAAVIGVPDAYRGETPKCFVVLKPGAHLTADELLAFLKQRIGKHEMPEFVEFRTDLPKSPIGKILKKELVAEEKTEGGGKP